MPLLTEDRIHIPRHKTRTANFFFIAILIHGRIPLFDIELQRGEIHKTIRRSDYVC